MTALKRAIWFGSQKERLVESGEEHADFVRAERRQIERKAHGARQQPLRDFCASRDGKRHSPSKTRVHFGEMEDVVPIKPLDGDWALRLQGFGYSAARIDDNGVDACHSLHHFSGTHFNPPSRDDAHHVAASVTDDVARHLRPGKKLLDDGLWHVLLKER